MIKWRCMTLREFYAVTGGDYDSVIANFKEEERILKFVKMVAGDPSFNLCEKALEEGNYSDAFRGAHTIKGFCLNLAFNKLAASASALTENLRGKSADGQTPELFRQLKEDYTCVIEGIKSLD